MKSVAVLAVFCCLAFIGLAVASPVPEVSHAASKTVNALEATGRQAVAAPAPAATDDDDDDDDDDDEDDIDLDLTGDDDDDDDDDDDEDEKETSPVGTAAVASSSSSSSNDDDDDDDDDDYLERFIDDIFGGDEDDDDDDETSSIVEPVVPASPVQVPQQAVQAAPSIPAAVQADLNALNAEGGSDEPAIVENSANEADGASYEDEESSDVVPEGQAASNLEAVGASNIAPGAGTQANPLVIINQAAPVVAQAATSEEDDDDDDDDEDDVDLGIPDIDDEDEDDDDDDDDDEEEDDDDDDDELDGITDARRAARAMESDPNSHVPAIYVAKYNRFVDNILGRINKILKTKYDPVTVKLTNPSTNTKSTKTKSSSLKKNKKKTSSKKSKNASKSVSSAPTEATDKSATSAAPKDIPETLKSATTVATTEYTSNAVPQAVATTPRVLETAVTAQQPENRSGTSSSTKKPKRKRTKSKNKNKTSSGSTSTGNKNKTKVKKQSKPRARATLYGLSSLKRSGDVSVNMMSDHTTIKTKFSLGPLILKVEKEFGRAAKRELRSATATTTEMSGKLSLRVLHGGAATLHSIRVLQPKQVRVESADDHDRTREFVWRRSPHIAYLVSQKLSSATRSMLRPPPIPVAIAA